MKKRSVAIVGGGQMGRALAGGMIQSGFCDAADLTVIDPNKDCRSWWAERFPRAGIADQITAESVAADVVLLAVKPHVITDLLPAIAELCPQPKLTVSIAAGVSLAAICDRIGHRRVIRVMPNTPSLVGAGASAFCAAEDVGDDDLRWIETALAGVGTAHQVVESQMDAVTGLSGSGPAYICLVIEALADGGVLTGLPRPLAMQLAAQTVLGTAKLVMETGKHPGELKDAVASPGGTTIAALKSLEENGLRAALINAVQASAEKSKQLGG